MKYISEYDLNELGVQNIGSPEEAYLMSILLGECKELDELTVTKLRPMNEAPVSGRNILLKPKNTDNLYEACFLSGKWASTAPGHSNLLDADSFDGWIPMPEYKPEE